MADTDHPAPSAVGPLLQGRFAGPTDFQALVRSALERAAAAGWREMVWSDADFEDWPLGERAVAQSLQLWARTGRRLVLLARSYAEVQRRHARFVAWRGTWAHIIECRVCPAADASELPSAIWSPEWCLHRLDRERCTGIGGVEPERRLALREALDEWLRRSSPGFPASVLGL